MLRVQCESTLRQLLSNAGCGPKNSTCSFPDSNIYGEGSQGMLIDQYAENKTAQTLDGEEYEKEALIMT